MHEKMRLLCRSNNVTFGWEMTAKGGKLKIFKYKKKKKPHLKRFFGYFGEMSWIILGSGG